MEKAVTIAVLVALASVGLSSAAVYTVGDGAGWTIPEDGSYNTWAANKKFEAGDVLRFVYKTTVHSVLMVTREDYLACNTASPVRSFHSGDDSITLPTPGHCGHCRKLGIVVHKPKVI